MAKILTFESAPPTRSQHHVGRVQPDGSIVFRGGTYRTFADVPPECRALHPSVETLQQWRALYRPIDPRLKRKRWVLELPSS